MLAWGTALPQEGTRASQSTHSRAQSEETPWQTTQILETTILGGHDGGRSSAGCALVFRYQEGIRVLPESQRAQEVHPAAARRRTRWHTGRGARCLLSSCHGGQPLLPHHRAVHGSVTPPPRPDEAMGLQPGRATGRRSATPEAPRRHHRGAAWGADPDHVY